MLNFSTNLIKKLLKFSPSGTSSSLESENTKFLDKKGLLELLGKIAGIETAIKEEMYPRGIIIELIDGIDPANAIGGTWIDVTSNYSLPVNVKKWRRVIPSNANKANLEKYYNQYKDYDSTKYTEASWAVFAAAIEKAKEVLEDPEVSQEEVDNTFTDLVRAQLGLRLKS